MKSSKIDPVVYLFPLLVSLFPIQGLLATTLSINDFKDNLWTEGSLEEALYHFKKAAGCRKTDDCSKCFSHEVVELLKDSEYTGSPGGIAVYLLGALLDPTSYCGGSSLPSYLELHDMITSSSSLIITDQHEFLESLLERLSMKLPKIILGEDRRHEDGSEHNHMEEGHSEQPDHRGHGIELEDTTEDESHNDRIRHVKSLERCFSVAGLEHEYEWMKQEGLTVIESYSILIINHILSGDAIDGDCSIPVLEMDVLADVLRSLNVNVENTTHISVLEFKHLVENLKLGHIEESGHDGHDENGYINHNDNEDGHDEHESHRHGSIMSRQQKRKIHQHNHKHEENTAINKCWTAEEILALYKIDVVRKEKIPVSLLPEISLFLVQQINGKYCLSQVPDELAQAEPTHFEKWGASTLSVLVISLLALLGGFLFPCLHKEFVQDILTLFIGLAVGTMAGDALLHLIPQALNLHNHSSHGSHGSGELTIEDYSWKMLVVVAAVYVFFVFELLMSRFGHSHVSSASEHNHHQCSESYEVTPRGDVEDTPCTNTNHSISDSSNYIQSSSPEIGKSKLFVGGGSDSDDNLVDAKKSPWWKLPTVAYMIIAGDALHNMVDGLAIGAAFAASWKEGLTLSIAILCHELPHELGDFAVLLATGLTPAKVLLANFFCACCAFVGLYIGVNVSSDVTTRQWIFALTAGMFLYVSLVNMVPELVNRKGSSRCKVFFLQNLGLLLGFGCMFAIAVGEHSIQF